MDVQAMTPVQDTDAHAGETLLTDLDAELSSRKLEITSRYLFSNLLPTPLITAGFCALLQRTHPLSLVLTWGGLTIVTWIATLAIVYACKNDPRRTERRLGWTVAICIALVLSCSVFASISVVFWIDGDRLNNIMMYTVIAGALASAGAQSAPSPAVLIANLAPYAVAFLQLSLGHEEWPTSVGFATLQVCYIVLVVLTSKAVWHLVDEMLRLRHEKRALIARLQAALVETKAARARAESASRAKSEFLANMSHELRTPLNAVLGFSEIIKERAFGDSTDRYAEYGEHIHFSGKHLLGLISDILDLSKIEAGKRELDETNVDLTDLASDALRFVEPQADQKSLKLRLEAPARIVLRADERALRQILVNLLSNAVKFTPQNGEISVSITRDAATAILCVRDTGVGIDPKEISLVMERFGQARHDIASTKEEGTGLGLPIVKGLAELHGGRVAITSAPGQGTSVTVSLPASRIVQAAGRTSAA
jgi:two-component system cell cycle sensor histidine kinase PleC